MVSQRCSRAHGDLTVRLGTRIRQFVDGLAVGIECLVFGPVVEMKPIDVVNEGLGGGVLREYQRVILDLDVIVGEGGRKIDVPLTSAPAWIRAPSTNSA